MTKKTKTMKLGTKDYAQVKDRIQAFRKDNPRGLIETNFEVEDSFVTFRVRVLKDKGDPNSAEATGSSYGELIKDDPKKKIKIFEKQETIAVGRALALLGYASDGEIASSEEMEEYEAYKEEKWKELLNEAKNKLENTKSLEDLGKVWSALFPKVKIELDSLKNKLKEKYDSKKV